MKAKRLRGIYRMPDSRYWWFRYQQNGKRYSCSLRTESEAEAITRAQVILAEGLIASEAYNNPSEPPARRREIHSMIERYLEDAVARNKKPLRPGTAKSRRAVLTKFVKDVGISRVGEITAQKINQWLAALKAQGRSQATLWTYGQDVRTFAKYLTPKYLSSSAMAEFILPDHAVVGRKNWLCSTDIAKVLDAANHDPDLKFALLCGFDAGLRRSEVSEARVNWFSLESGLLHVSNNNGYVTKDRDNRTIPLTDRFAEFLKGYLSGRDQSQYVLAPWKTSKGIGKYRYDTNKRVRSHFRRCNVSCTYHDMRRSFASTLASAGASIYKVANWLGDGIEVVSKSYGHLAPKDADINLGVYTPSARDAVV